MSWKKYQAVHIQKIGGLYAIRSGYLVFPHRAGVFYCRLKKENFQLTNWHRAICEVFYNYPLRRLY